MSVPEQLEGLIVFKVGSSTLINDAGKADIDYIASLCDQMATLVAEGKHVVLVSSGAAAIGRDRLGFTSKPKDIPSLQACASAGQAALTEIYANELGLRGIPCGQVLLTRRDVVDREGYLNARNTLYRLLDLGAIPVVNENDTVGVAEFAFGDNDTLGALVSTLVGAELYVILSDVEGLYDCNPMYYPDAKLLPVVREISDEVVQMAGGAGSDVGTGGMASKLRAARATLAAGIPTIICNGRREGVLLDVAHGESVGTRFEARPDADRESGRKLWIGLADVPHGTLVVDEGAKRAIVSGGGSVLPVGVIKTKGSYKVGDVVNVVDLHGHIIARGISRYSSTDMKRIYGLKLDVIQRFMPPESVQPAIHRDEMLVF